MQAEAGMSPRLSVIAPDRRGGEQARSVDVEHDLLVANRIVGFEKLDARAQTFIRMRSKLINYAKDSGQRIFAVTSVEPGAGKTHVAINLAAALSRITPTALVELDLRRPSIAARLGLTPPSRGVDDFIGDGATWSETGLRINGFSLHVHCVRAPRDNAEELLTSGGLRSLFEMLRTDEERPICIIDTSPMTVEDDFMLVARAIDGVLMVVEEGRTTKRALLEAAEALKPTPILGSILNKSMWKSRNGSDYGYYGTNSQPAN